jgi:ribosomal-protein-alanine N-acetyltransferase
MSGDDEHPGPFRLAVEADLPALEDLEARSFEEPWPRTALASELSLQPSFFLLADGASGDLDAYASFRVVADEAELLRIAVSPVRRHRGLAAALLAAGLERCHESGARRCFLEVREDNHGAIRLYRACGFRPTGRRGSYYQDGATALLMILDPIPGRALV